MMRVLCALLFLQFDSFMGGECDIREFRLEMAHKFPPKNAATQLHTLGMYRFR